MQVYDSIIVSMNKLPPELKAQFDQEYGPILAEFTLDQTPQGGAPLHVREQWVGTPLPVRETSIAQLAMGEVEYFDVLTFNAKRNDDPVSILGMEAIEALVGAGKIDAADFWVPYQDGLFTFRGYEGQLRSLE